MYVSIPKKYHKRGETLVPYDLNPVIECRVTFQELSTLYPGTTRLVCWVPYRFRQE